MIRLASQRNSTLDLNAHSCGFGLVYASRTDEGRLEHACQISPIDRNELIDIAIKLLNAAEVTEFMVDRTPRGPGHPR